MFRIWGNSEYVDVYIYEEIECCSVPDTHNTRTDIRFLPRSVNLLLEFVAVLYSLYTCTRMEEQFLLTSVE